MSLHGVFIESGGHFFESGPRIGPDSNLVMAPTQKMAPTQWPRLKIVSLFHLKKLLYFVCFLNIYTDLILNKKMQSTGACQRLMGLWVYGFMG